MSDYELPDLSDPENGKFIQAVADNREWLAQFLSQVCLTRALKYDEPRAAMRFAGDHPDRNIIVKGEMKFKVEVGEGMV